VIDQLGDGGWRFRQAPNDAEPVDVGERAVERAQLAKLIGLVDDRGECPADPGR
jgi:hypothetical protein